MKNLKIESFDTQLLRYVLSKIETSFGVSLVDLDLKQLNTLGELSDLITSKILRKITDEDAAQQAFFELRDAIATLFAIDAQIITPGLPLTEFLPRAQRSERISQLEHYLDVRLNVLRPAHWITDTLMALFVASIVALFFNWRFGLIGIGSSFVGMWFSKKIGKELNVKTLEQLSKKIAKENHFKPNGHPSTDRKNDIENQIIQWLQKDLGILTP
jgi:hypothetical protein